MKKRSTIGNLVLMTALVFAVFGCSQKAHSGQANAAPAKTSIKASLKAVAVISPTQGSEVTGVVHFTQTAEGVRVTGAIEHLTPGKHGFHVHEAGDCTGPQGKTAGGHFNPDNMPHGGPMDAKRHVGDLGNIIADTNGTAVINMVDTVIALQGPHSIIGRSVIVHAGEDDLTSQPSGDAGPRVGCGVIGYAEGSGQVSGTSSSQ